MEGRCGQLSLTQVLLRARRDILGDGSGIPTRVYGLLLRSKVSLAGDVALILLALWDMLTSPASVALRVPLRLLIGAVSCTAAQCVFVIRAHVARDAVDMAVAAARSLEASTLDESRNKRLHAAAVGARRLLLGYRAFMTGAASSVVGTMVVDGTLYRTPFKALVQAFTATNCIFAYYSLLSLLLILYSATAALYVEASRPMAENARAGGAVRCAKMCAHLQALCRRMGAACGVLYPIFVALSLLMPMVSTTEFLVSKGDTDVFALGTVPLVFIIFVPLCLAGQRLEDASSGVSWWCYAGPWLSESVQDRRHRVMLMHMAWRPCSLHVHTVAKLNRPTCAEVCRTWFSYFQMLVNFVGR